MQLRAFLFLSFLSFVFSASAQNYTAVWEGSFLTNSKNKVNVRIEVVQNGNSLHGVVTTSEFEKNTDQSCVYVVPGSISRYALTLEMSRTQRASSIRNDGCSAFRKISWFVVERDSVNTTSAVWYGTDGSSQDFVIRKTATEVSKKAREKMKVLKVEDGDHPAFPEYLGERLVENKEISIIVTSVEKKSKAPITVTLNGRALAENFDLSENVLVLRLKDIAQVNNVDFINVSTRKSWLDVKISFQQGTEKKDWDASVFTGGKVSLRLNRKE